MKHNIEKLLRQFEYITILAGEVAFAEIKEKLAPFAVDLDNGLIYIQHQVGSGKVLLVYIPDYDNRERYPEIHPDTGFPVRSQMPTLVTPKNTIDEYMWFVLRNRELYK